MDDGQAPAEVQEAMKVVVPLCKEIRELMLKVDVQTYVVRGKLSTGRPFFCNTENDNELHDDAARPVQSSSENRK